jgi:hypothetical protein
MNNIFFPNPSPLKLWFIKKFGEIFYLEDEDGESCFSRYNGVVYLLSQEIIQEEPIKG